MPRGLGPRLGPRLGLRTAALLPVLCLGLCALAGATGAAAAAEPSPALQSGSPSEGAAPPPVPETITIPKTPAAPKSPGAKSAAKARAETKPHAGPPRKPAAIVAEKAELTGSLTATSFVLDLSAGVPAEVFTLADPYRVVVDLPDVKFNLPAGTGQKGQGLVSAFRYGLLALGKARIVLDTVQPVLIGKAEMTTRGGKAVRLTVDLTPTTAQTFGAGTGALRPAAAPMKREAEEGPANKKNRAKPLILIDAGHGGVDPGASSPTSVQEKTVVLAVARKLQERLTQGGRYTVEMTRTRDVFVSLDQRLKISRKLGADLFISLHADSIKDYASTVRGATVYTLSERASDETARLMAEKENASDAIAGLSANEFEDQGEVRSILIDLLKRETANFSADFSTTLVKGMGKTVSLSRDPQRSAAFKVLRQADTPSVLVELGYMSHPEDEKLLTSAAWQRSVADAIGTAVDSYFTKRTAKAR
jgi:N-acetylmuramoyl-L-alanine amidase